MKQCDLSKCFLSFVLAFAILSPAWSEDLSKDNYLAAVASSNLMRFNEPGQIRVFVKSGNGVFGYRDEFQESLESAFKTWSDATGAKVAFSFQSQETGAQIVVSWTSDLTRPELRSEAGMARTHYGNGIESAEILLLTIDKQNKEALGKNVMYCVCLHEIGHALGLQGHSPYDDDIMSASLGTQRGLSRRDINTINALYARKEEIDELPSTDEYGRPLSPQIKSERLARLGTSSCFAGNYKRAIEILRGALRLNPANELARKNISAAANNLAGIEGLEQKSSLKLLYTAIFWDSKNQTAVDNLKQLLKRQGQDPNSFNVRVALAERYLQGNELQAAAVEYQQALLIKADINLENKLAGLRNLAEKNP